MSNQIAYDDVLTIPLPNSDIVFTRYFYIKDEVRAALLLSLLNVRDDAIFWAYELYWSGFVNELIGLIWQIYYDFYAVLNPSFEPYLKTKFKSLVKSRLQKRAIQHNIISVVIQNLLMRPFNTDVFIIRTLNNVFELDYDKTPSLSAEDRIHRYLATCDYVSLSIYILSITEEQQATDMLAIIIEEISKNARVLKKKTMTQWLSCMNEHTCHFGIKLLGRVLNLIYKANTPMPIKETRLYLNTTGISITQYKSQSAYSFKALSELATCDINAFQMADLFALKQKKYTATELVFMYSDKWLYQASFSPIWNDRIKKYRGYTDYIKKQVVFIDDDDVEKFHDMFDYEIDEQCSEVKRRLMVRLNKNSWSDFYEAFKGVCILNMPMSELQELDGEHVKY